MITALFVLLGFILGAIAGMQIAFLMEEKRQRRSEAERLQREASLNARVAYASKDEIAAWQGADLIAKARKLDEKLRKRVAGEPVED